MITSSTQSPPDAGTPWGHIRALMVLGLPLAGSQVAQLALHMIDTVMLGWYAVLPLAAGVLGSSSFFVVYFLGSGFGKAVVPLVAAARARGDERQVRRVTRMGLWLSILFGLACYPLFWWSRDLLLLLGQKPEVAALAQDYLRIAGLGMVPALMTLVLRGTLSGMERTQIVMWATVGALPFNALLNYALIFGNFGFPEMGVTGSAIATLIVQLLSLAVLMLYCQLNSALRIYHFFQRFHVPDWPDFRSVFRLGMPMGLTSLAEGGMFNASALMMGWIGPVALASHGIALELSALTFMLHVGLSSAVTVRTGAFFGAGNYAAMRLGARMAIVVAGGVVALTIFAFLAFPDQLIGLFIAAEEPARPEILALGRLLLACAALFQVADSMQVLALGLLAGVQDTRVPMWLAAFSYWVVGVPSSYVLGIVFGFGPVGLWLGLVLGLAFAAATMMARFWIRLPRAATV